MEVVESPLNLAHQQSRKADRLLAAGKHEEAITCHGRAADLLTEAMKLTQCEQTSVARFLSLRDGFSVDMGTCFTPQSLTTVKRQLRHSFFGRKPHPASASLPRCAGPAVPAAAAGEPPEAAAEYDTWLYLLKNKGAPAEPCAGSKALKDDRTRLEEQETALADLRKLVDFLLAENEKLTQENQRLKTENARLKRAPLEREPYADADFVEKSELWGLSQPSEDRKAKDIPIPHLPPLEMPAQDISLEDLPPVELPEDIQNELQELLDRVK
uniref:Nuclear receptor binding factor 2b n=1 Tax=Lepisosteus oculatus TaxID=7918 RepID=W5MIU2_LEPOC